MTSEDTIKEVRENINNLLELIEANKDGIIYGVAGERITITRQCNNDLPVEQVMLAVCDSFYETTKMLGRSALEFEKINFVNPNSYTDENRKNDYIKLVKNGINKEQKQIEALRYFIDIISKERGFLREEIEESEKRIIKMRKVLDNGL